MEEPAAVAHEDEEGLHGATFAFLLGRGAVVEADDFPFPDRLVEQVEQGDIPFGNLRLPVKAEPDRILPALPVGRTRE